MRSVSRARASRLGDVMIGAGIGFALTFAGSFAALADSPPHVDRAYAAPQPDYPATAQVAGEQGDVVMDVLVSSSGMPMKVRVAQSSGFKDLDDAAVSAIATWHYVPAVKGGDTATVWGKFKIHFELPQPVAAPTPASAATTPSH